MISRKFPQMFVFCYHKSGTQLFSKTLRGIARHFGLKMEVALGAVEEIDSAVDIVLVSHSLIRFDLGRHSYRGVRIVRDPRGIWVSGYWYHRRCSERWCLNTNFDTSPTIRFPQVPYSQEHRSETWKQDYLGGLDGRSYQENLLALDVDAGLAFEEERYADWTAEAMTAWQPDERTIDVQMESIAANFDASMKTIFSHLGFSGDRLADVIRISQSNDIARMSDEAVANNSHITSRDISLWQHYLPPEKRRRFEDQHGALIRSLGYPAESFYASGGRACDVKSWVTPSLLVSPSPFVWVNP
jgi:hypothetical protein